MEKRVERIINHLLGTSLPLCKALTEIERNDAAFVRTILTQLTQEAPTYKWKRIDVTA